MSVMANGDQQVSGASSAAFSSNHESAVASGSESIASPYPTTNGHTTNRANHINHSSATSSSPLPKLAGGAHIGQANEPSRAAGAIGRVAQVHRPDALGTAHSAPGLHSGEGSHRLDSSAMKASRAQHSGTLLQTPATAQNGNGTTIKPTSAPDAQTPRPIHASASNPPPQASTPSSGAGHDSATHSRQATSGSGDAATDEIDGSAVDDLLQIRGVRQGSSGSSGSTSGGADQHRSGQNPASTLSGISSPAQKKSRKASGSAEHHIEHTHTHAPAKLPRVKIRLNHAAAAAGAAGAADGEQGVSKKGQGAHLANTSAAAPVASGQIQSTSTHDSNAASTSQFSQTESSESTNGQVGVSTSLSPPFPEAKPVHNASIGKAPVNGISHPSLNLSPPTQASSAVPRIVVVKREGPQQNTEDSEHTVQTSDSTTSVKNGQTTPQDANDTEESMRRKRRRGNTNGSASGQVASGSDMDEDSDSQMADTPLAQAHAPHGSAAVSLRPVGKPLVSSRDFVPLPPDLSQPSEPFSSSSSMKRTERKIKADPGVVVPDPSLHPTRKPPTQHGTVRPLPLYKPLHAASNGNGDASRASGKAAATGLGEGPQIPTHHNTPRHPPPRARPRLFGLEEAPVFYPTPEEFADPLKYIQWCGEPDGGNGKAYGIVKVVPPEGWSPDFVLEQEDFRFRTRVQQLNSLSADARASQNYEEQLHKYHAQTGTKRVTIPTVGGKLVDLYQLKLLVHSFGGADAVGLNRKWSEVTRRLDYDEKDAGHLSAQIKRAYMKIIAPFEDFLQANREPRKRSNSAAAKVKAASEDDVAAPAESASASQSMTAMDEDVQDTNDANENDENFEDTHYAETGPGKRRSARRRTETKGAPTTLTVQPTRRRKRKRGVSPAHESTQTSSSEGSFAKGAEEQMCEICLSGDNGKQMLLCDECDRGYHMYCLDPPMTSIPNSEWYCPPCLVGTGNDFGFDDGETHSLWSFWQRAEAFRTSWWTDNAEKAVWKAEDGRENGVTRPLSNGSMSISEDDVEREFWRLVHSPNEPVEVEYGADVHSTTHGTALPTREKQPLNPYSSDGWNLNNLPTLEASLLRHIKSDVSGMTVPWLYVGMIFSTFCWHAEDHFTYSINYQHLGDTKTWYGVPGEDADKLEAALRKAAPDLFEQTPDLLFHLTTMISPEKLKKEGVRVYACDQRANEFVITFPKAYHSGFNHGFNFNEAVNFALPDWVPLGLECVRRYQQFGRYPVFSHDQLLVTVYQQSQTIETAAWLREPLREMVERELKRRDALRTTEDGQEILITYHFVDNDFEEEKEYQCEHCKLFCYLGQVTSQFGSQVACLEHAMEVHGWKRDDWILRMRFSDEDLEEMLSKTEERANIPNNWNARLHKLVVSSPNPPLRSLRALLAEGEKTSEHIPEVVQLRDFVDKANRWTEEAMIFVARRHQKRATAATREGAVITTNGGTIGDDSTAELGEEETLYTLLQEAEQLPFDAPEVGQLRSVVASIQVFKTRAQGLLRRAEKGAEPTLAECKEVRTTADNLNVRLDEMEALQEYISRREWCSDMEQVRERFTTLDEVEQYIEEGRKLGVHSSHDLMTMLAERYQAGQKWQAESESVLGASRKQLPQWTNDSSKYSLQLVGERSIDACHYRLADVERLLKATYEIPIAADLHKPLETLSAKVKDFGKQCTSLLKAEPSSNIVAHIDSVERLLQQCSRVNVVAEGEAELTRLMAKQDIWTAAYEDLINKLTDMCTDRTSPPQPSSSTTLAEWFMQCCNRVSKCLDPADEAPSSYSATLSCVCRTKETIESEAKVTCIRCNCDYHIACLRIPEHELVPNRIKTYVCPFCDVKKLPRLVKPWRRSAVPLKAFSEAAISNDEERFPWGVPETKRALDSALARAVHFQDALTSCLSQSVNPRSKAGHALVVHLLKKCFGLPFNLDTPAQRPAASFLSEVLLAHAGYDAEGKPARAIPWRNLRPTDLRYAPDVLPAGSQPVQQGRSPSTLATATRADATVASPVLPEAGSGHQRDMPMQSTPRSTEVRHASAGDESRVSMDIDQTSTHDWQGGSVSHDDVTSRDAAFEKDDKKRKRGKRARFVFQEEVGIFVPVQNQRVYCLCRRPEHAPMITCDRCGMWYHAQCVNVDKDALAKSKTNDWMCPMCCVKTERRYPYGELKVKEMGVSDPNSWLDVRCTLRSTTGPISKLSHWTIEESQRIVLHLESYYPATSADAEQKADAGNDGEAGKDAANRATSQSSSSASNPSSYALGSVAIDSTWTDAKARVTPLHRTPYEEEMARLRQIDYAKRQEIGMKNLFSRGVTPAMVEKWFIGWNGNELVYPRRDRLGVLSEVPLGTHLELAADDQDGTRVVLAALDREAADLRARGLPVPEFAGPPTAPPLRQVPPTEGRYVHAHPEQPMPAPSSSVPYAASQRVPSSTPSQMYNGQGAPPDYTAYPAHGQPHMGHGREHPHERSQIGLSQEHRRHDAERSMHQRDRQTSSRPAFDLPQIPPYRGQQGNSDMAEQGPSNGGRTTAPFHRPIVEPVRRPQGEARPSPSSAGPSSSASFASQMRQVPLAPAPQHYHGQLSYSQAPHVPHDAYGLPAGGQYGHGSHGCGHGRDFGQYSAHDEHRRPRATSNASPAAGYASPGQHARLGPSPSGRPAMAHYSPSQRPRSPPPASARYPLDLSGAEQGPYLGTHARAPSSHVSHVQSPLQHAREHYSHSREQMPAGGQRMQLPPAPTHDSTQLDPRTSAPYTREDYFRDMARRMQPEASQAEIEDMARRMLS